MLGTLSELDNFRFLNMCKHLNRFLMYFQLLANDAHKSDKKKSVSSLIKCILKRKSGFFFFTLSLGITIFATFEESENMFLPEVSESTFDRKNTGLFFFWLLIQPSGLQYKLLVVGTLMGL